jgi:Fe-S cluster assembly protein SufD
MITEKENILLGAENPLITAVCKQASDSFAKHGIPNRKNEEYKYTPLDSYFKKPFNTHVKLNESINIDSLKIFKKCNLVVILNGTFNEGLSNIIDNDFFIGSMSLSYQTHKNLFEKHFSAYADFHLDSMVAMNTSLIQDGVFIHVPKNTAVANPIHILNVVTSGERILSQPRNLVILEDGSSADITTSYETVTLSDTSFTNTVTEIYVGKNAKLENHIIENECENGMLLNSTYIYQLTGSFTNTYTFCMQGKLIRNNLNIILGEQACEAHLYGYYHATDNRHIDNHTLVDHRMPHCESNELYKGVAADKSVVVFNGKIYVRKDAQKTNAFQSNKNILLSDNATINTKPQLEIYADDVKCSHGTTTGRLDEQALFYLRARGIGKDAAQELLLHAFTSEVVDKVKNSELKSWIQDHLPYSDSE